MLQYKRCPKCHSNHRYKNIIDLYEVKDSHSIWTCDRCNYQEIISNSELVKLCQIKQQRFSVQP